MKNSFQNLAHNLNVTFLEEILEGYHEYPRISRFNQQFRYIPSEKKRFFLKK